jgi:hypothetical protein
MKAAKWSGSLLFPIYNHKVMVEKKSAKKSPFESVRRIELARLEVVPKIIADVVAELSAAAPKLESALNPVTATGAALALLLGGGPSMAATVYGWVSGCSDAIGVSADNVQKNEDPSPAMDKEALSLCPMGYDRLHVFTFNDGLRRRTTSVGCINCCA